MNFNASDVTYTVFPPSSVNKQLRQGLNSRLTYLKVRIYDCQKHHSLPFIQPINIKKPQLVYSTSDNSGEAPLKNIKKLSDCWLDLGICRTTIQCIIIFPPLSGLSSLVFSHNGVKKVVVLIYFNFPHSCFVRYRSRCIKVCS